MPDEHEPSPLHPGATYDPVDELLRLIEMPHDYKTGLAASRPAVPQAVRDRIGDLLRQIVLVSFIEPQASSPTTAPKK